MAEDCGRLAGRSSETVTESDSECDESSKDCDATGAEAPAWALNPGEVEEEEEGERSGSSVAPKVSVMEFSTKVAASLAGAGEGAECSSQDDVEVRIIRVGEVV